MQLICVVLRKCRQWWPGCSRFVLFIEVSILISFVKNEPQVAPIVVALPEI